jgi:hypothetical protein
LYGAVAAEVLIAQINSHSKQAMQICENKKFDTKTILKTKTNEHAP